MNRIYIGLGSNLGDRRLNIIEAYHHLLKIQNSDQFRISKIYESDPVDGSDQPPYLNAVMEAQTGLSPFEWLDCCQMIEKQMGRERHELQRWNPRIIDIDILFYGDRIIETNLLTIPHPEISFRSFVLEPMCELNADFIHPAVHLNMKQLADHLVRDLNIHEYSDGDNHHV